MKQNLTNFVSNNISKEVTTQHVIIHQKKKKKKYQIKKQKQTKIEMIK